MVLALLFLADVVVFSTDNEWESGAVSVVMLLVGWFFWPPLAAFIASHTLHEIVVYVGGYLGLGVAVAFAKWIFFNLGIARKLKELGEDFRSVSESYASFYRYVEKNMGINKLLQRGGYIPEGDTPTDTFTPRAKNYVSRFTIWTLQWPVVAVDMVASEFIVKIGKHVATIADALFSSIGRALVGNAVKGLK